MLWNRFPCLDFVDSELSDHAGSGRRFDRLPLAEWQRAFLDHWGWAAPVPAGTKKVAELRAVRSRLRRLLESAPRAATLAVADVRSLDRLLAASPFVYRIAEPPRVVAEPLRRDWNWVVAELVRSTIEVLTSTAGRRLKVCANPDCSWLFFDESLNLSRRWCQANICGNLVKVREHRARRRQQPR